MKLYGMKHAVAVLTLMMASMVAQAANWTITDLGTLGGSSSHATGINNRGQIVGASSLAGDLGSHAFLYTNGGMYDLGTLGGPSSEANGINSAGKIVGSSSLNGGGPELRAFLYSDGKMQDIGAIYSSGGAGRPRSWATAINNRGQVVGASNLIANSYGSVGSMFGFIYSNSAISRISDQISQANSINDRGQVVGFKFVYTQIPASLEFLRRRAVLFSNGVVTELGTLYGGQHSSSTARGINAAGDIVGESSPDGAFNRRQAFLYRKGTLLNLGAMLGFASSGANGINNAGDIVGTGIRQEGEESRPFLYSKGTNTDLSALPEVLAAGWTLQDATAINDVGQIVGWGYRNGQQRAYLLSPSR